MNVAAEEAGCVAARPSADNHSVVALGNPTELTRSLALHGVVVGRVVIVVLYFLADGHFVECAVGIGNILQLGGLYQQRQIVFVVVRRFEGEAALLPVALVGVIDDFDGHV